MFLHTFETINMVSETAQMNLTLGFFPSCFVRYCPLTALNNFSVQFQRSYLRSLQFFQKTSQGRIILSWMWQIFAIVSLDQSKQPFVMSTGSMDFFKVYRKTSIFLSTLKLASVQSRSFLIISINSKRDGKTKTTLSSDYTLLDSSIFILFLFCIVFVAV